jgi:hypothetical protein
LQTMKRLSQRAGRRGRKIREGPLGTPKLGEVGTASIRWERGRSTHHFRKPFGVRHEGGAETLEIPVGSVLGGRISRERKKIREALADSAAQEGISFRRPRRRRTLRVTSTTGGACCLSGMGAPPGRRGRTRHRPMVQVRALARWFFEGSLPTPLPQKQRFHPGFSAYPISVMGDSNRE